MGAVSFSYANKFDLSKVGWEQGIRSFECHKTEIASES